MQLVFLFCCQPQDLNISSVLLSIVIRKFVDRKEELRALDEHYKSKKAEFFIIYGRRRIGKTELVKQFVASKPHFYFLAQEQNISLERERFQKKFAEKFNIFLRENSSFEDIFREILSKMPVKEKFIFVIDEFPFWIAKHKPVVSEFQHIWDELLSRHNVFLVLLGSSISVMESEVLSYKSPLYGRRTGQLKIESMKERFLHEFFPHYSIEDIFKVYGAVGGVPFYLQEFSDECSFQENIDKTFFNKANILNQEAEILLREELREVNTYFNILKAVMDGATKLAEISSKARVDITNINKYLSSLMTLHLIKKEHSITTSSKTKNFIYVLNDNYFRFWLTFLYPYKDELESNKQVLSRFVNKNYSHYMGKIFENICRKNLNAFINNSYTQIGRWWHKEEEIDIIALNEESREILFAECKWQDNADAKKIVFELAAKALNVEWHNKDRKESYAVFAKSFKKKIKFLNGKTVKCISLKDIGKVMKN